MSPSAIERLRRWVSARLARPERLFVTAGAPEFGPWCREHPGTSVELVVSARALHELVCEPGLPLPDLDAVRAYAEQQFAHYFGPASQRYAIAPWRLGDAAGASAMHGLDLAALRAQAGAAGVRLHAVRPAWAVWLASLPATARAASGRVVWHEGDVAVAIELDRGRVVALLARRVRAVDELGGDAPLAVGTPESELAAQPGPAVPAPDFLPRSLRSPLAWPLAITGAVVLATAAWSAFDSYRMREAAQGALNHAALLRSSTAGPVRNAARPAPSENRAAVEARALLATPWESILTRVETAGADAKSIAWLGLDASGGRGELRLDGLAPDKLLALQLAEQLGSTPGWSQVVLSRLSGAEAGLTGQRFEINVRLQKAVGS